MWEHHQEKLRYRFENFIARGGLSIFISLFILFILCFIVALIARGILILIFPDSDLIGNIFEQMWVIFLMMTDPGNMGIDMESTGWVRISTIIAGMLGVIIFSMLIAFITTAVDSLLEELQKGHSKVLEENHTLILGWNDRVLDILKELIIANESEEDAAIVILADREKGEMDDEIKTFIEDTKTTRIITRSGTTSSPTKLLRVNADKAKSAIILASCSEGALEDEKRVSDAKVIKSILGLKGTQNDRDEISIVAELFYESNRKLLDTFESENISSVDSWDILAKILVQTSRTSGLAVVYNELLSFDGCELYFCNGKWGGKNFYDSIYHFPDGIPLGLRRADGTLLLRPPRDTVLNSDDELIIVAEDDSTIVYKPQPIAQAKDHAYTYRRREEQVERELLLGWHCMTSTIIREYSGYLPAGSAIDIMVSNPKKKILNELDTLKEAHPELTINIIDKNPMSHEDLASIRPFTYDNVLILSHCESGLSPERVDAETIFVLLILRKIISDRAIKDRTTTLITQVLNSENQELITQTTVDDFLISNKMVSMIFAQLSEESSMKDVYADMFDEEGSEFYLKPVSLYFDTLPSSVTFADMIGVALKRDEICFGVRIGKYTNSPKENFGVKLNPKKNATFTLTEGDSLVVLSEDEY